jgi:hypothetical protein
MTDHASGERVVVDYDVPQTPPSTYAPLIEFLTGAFARESAEVHKLVVQAADPDRFTLHRLGGRALAFSQLLGHWEAHARRLYKHAYATELDLTRDEHADSKRTGREIEAAAEQPILPLREALERIQTERASMIEIARWARDEMKALVGEEISGEAAGNPDVDDDFYVPAAPDLSRLS